ncbi:hypothetical protein [Conexibacter sp. DBS9H8]|uniref:hypothetical protein n=1 Tax=Conexibacter sp. DBS9H8 TaxID=2937801 RepID=UPI00200D0ACB|nr:hypothetical protein [Conexibacter sp. DBS9H8]
MSGSWRWQSSVAVGVAASMRSMAGPAVLALRGRVPAPVRPWLIAAGVGELALDKWSGAPDRIRPPAWVGRVIVGGLTAGNVAGWRGALSGGAAAGAATYLTWWVRGQAGRLSGRPDVVVAAVEDVCCYGLMGWATGPSRD